MGYLNDRAVQDMVKDSVTGKMKAPWNLNSWYQSVIGGDPQAAVDAAVLHQTSDKLHSKVGDSGFSYEQLGLDPNQTLTKGQVGNAIERAKKAQAVKDQALYLTNLKASQAPTVLAAKNQAKATSESTKATKDIALQQLLSGDKNAAAERLQQLIMAEDADTRAQQQWLRQMEYMDRKEQALREEKELETLIAGLSMLGANLFV